MADVPTVTIVNGLPTAGSGTVQTLSTTNTLIGEVQASPTTNTLLERVKVLNTSIQQLVTALGSTALDLGAGTGGTRTLRHIVDSSQLGTLGQTTLAGGVPISIASNQSGLANRAFSVAFATLTRPANTTAYTAADSISDNATAGSVTALVSGNISDANDDPIFLSEILVKTTDTGLAGKKLRAYVFNANPTSSSGVGAGDNVTYSQKQAGYIGSFQGYMETGFSDGAVGRLVPIFNETNYSAAGAFIPVLPVSGAKTLYIQYQAVEAFTPSANSTTIIGTARGWQARAA